MSFTPPLRNYLQYIGINAGSELVTANFERHFLEHLKGTKLPGMTQVLFKARQAFDLRKMQVGEDDEDESWELPGQWFKERFHKGLYGWSHEVHKASLISSV